METEHQGLLNYFRNLTCGVSDVHSHSALLSNLTLLQYHAKPKHLPIPRTQTLEHIHAPH